MAQQNFDDQKLINLARFNYYSTRSQASVVDLFVKEKLSNEERNQLLEFLEQTKQIKPLSISDMKREVFSKIGFHNFGSFGTISRAEMEAIYKYIMGIK